MTVVQLQVQGLEHNKEKISFQGQAEPRPIKLLKNKKKSPLSLSLSSVFPQVRCQPGHCPEAIGDMAGHSEGDRRPLRHLRPLLLPLPKMAALLQHHLTAHQFLLHRHPADRPQPQRHTHGELQRSGAAHRRREFISTLSKKKKKDSWVCPV